MHQTRQETTTKLPIRRKGTKYIARALIAPDNSVSVVSALRDVLGLARTAREVREMIKDRLIKINNRIVFDYRESVQLFNLFSVADKSFTLMLSETRKFYFEPAKDTKKRLCKIIGKKILSGNIIQVNLHDGTNIIGRKDMFVNDSVYLDMENKVVKHISVKDAKEAFVLSGKYAGLSCSVKSVKERKAVVSFKGKEGSVEIDISSIILL